MDDKIETGADASTKLASSSADPVDGPVAGPSEVESLREDYEPADWDDPFALELEKLLFSNMRTVFENATKTIIDCGYEEAVARKAVLRCGGLYQKGNDLVSNVVNDVLASLKKGKGEEGDMFQDLQQLLEYALVGMISVLRLLEPSVPIAEAMWRLLLLDLNIFDVCEVQVFLFQCKGLSELRSRSESQDESSSDSSPRSRSESQDEKDKLILELVSMLHELQNELRSWTEWTKGNVKLAVIQTRKAEDEIKSLSREKEELKRKEKMMECALNNKTKQVENAYSRLHELEVERSVLIKNKMEMTKVEEETSASTWRKAFEIEQKAVKDVESRDAQRTLLQKELASEKHKAAELKKKIAKAKKMHNQTKVLWEQERMEVKKFVAQAASIRKETECLEARARKEEDKMKLKSEKYGDEVKKLKDKLSELKVRLWRRCVMCLSEEKMVVFLPCAHQLLCVNCNQLHQKCCPACSSPITHRVCVRFADHVARLNDG